MGVALLFLVIGESMHSVAYGSILNHLQVENVKTSKGRQEKIQAFFYEQRKRTMAVKSSTIRRFKESKKNKFYREQKNSFCNIKCF